MKLAELIKDVDGIKGTDGNISETEIACLAMDSRQKEENGLFFCVKGERFDSHKLAGEAVKNGAVALVTEEKLSLNVPQIVVENSRAALGVISGKFYGEPSKKMQVIGITGTNGKTTTAHMLAAIVKKANKKVGVIGTLGIRYAEKEVPTELTTPDPIDLQRTLADMVLRGIKYVVMEVSAHALAYHKTDGVVFYACIFTNLTQDHLDFFPSMQAYKEAKIGLFTSQKCPIAVINGDEETGREIGHAIEAYNPICKTVFYGISTPTDAFAVVTDESLSASECVLNINDKLSRVRLSMAGRYNVYNALAAAACATELGVSSEEISLGLTSMVGVEGRLQRVGCKRGANIYVDFAHTPDGLEKSLETLRAHCKGRLICLFGCGGNRDKGKRPLMGATVAKKEDFAILTSDNPRYEYPMDIIGGIEKGYRRFSVRYVIVPDRKKAIEYALEILKKGDILLVAGKGGENYQEVMGIKYPFNDQDIIERALEKKGV